MTDLLGNVVWVGDHDPFGNRTLSSSPGLSVGFPGQYADTETGLMYNWHRYYHPALGRYLGIDPLLALTGTPYAYAMGEPGTVTDADGLCPWCIAGALIGFGLNLGYQLYQNGDNWDQVNWQQVVLSTLAGAASGGLGTVTAEFGLGANILANAVGSAEIGAVQKEIDNLLNGKCMWDGVAGAAGWSAFLDGAGAFAGALTNRLLYGVVDGQFADASLKSKLYASSNAIQFSLPSNAINWSVGGTATGNAVANVISDLPVSP